MYVFMCTHPHIVKYMSNVHVLIYVRMRAYIYMRCIHAAICIRLHLSLYI